MFKEKFNNIIGLSGFKTKLKHLVSIVSCSMLCCIPSTSSAYVVDTDIKETVNIENGIQSLNTNYNVQYISYEMCMEATAYSPDEGGSITASGHSLYDVIGWGVASNDFPIGTQLWIECPSAPWINGTYTVLDTGAMGYGVIDIAMNNMDECYEFGRRTIYVSVL